jgi:hypothetical protein
MVKTMPIPKPPRLGSVPPDYTPEKAQTIHAEGQQKYGEL